MITIPLRILLVEDHKTDVELTIHHIKKVVQEPIIRVVENLEDCKHELRSFIPDVVISDYNLPTCSGIEILELTRNVDDTIPFIFLTGAIEDEELAANTILAGATGYVLKKNMDVLSEKLRPLLKKIVFNMGVREEIREKVRRNKIVVNEIYSYLNDIRADNQEQRENIEKIRRNIERINFDDDVK